MFFGSRTPEMVDPSAALPGRDATMPVASAHLVFGTPMTPPLPENCDSIVVGMGCFWGAERKFWQLPGVYTTAVGYAGGFTPNPTYEETCSGLTGHTEVVLVVWDRTQTDLDAVLRCFWENHDPTQGHRQGNDIGTQYRSAIFCTDELQLAAAKVSAVRFGEMLSAAHLDAVTTEIGLAGPFFYAEDYHQQYLAKNPNGYCGLGGTGVTCPVGISGV
jgi:peptide-methionine (S)-S-oxide reductase